MSLYPYRVGHQIRKFTGQFARVMSGFQVSDGVDRDNDGNNDLFRVDVVYGKMSRVVASIINKRDNLNATSLPLMSIVVGDINIDNDSRMSKFHRDEMSANNPTNPNDVISRIHGQPLIITMNVSILATSNTQLYEILEQVLLVFNPRITIPTKATKHSADYLSDIELVGIGDTTQTPLGGDKEAYSIDLQFEMPVTVTYPHGVNDDIISEIQARVYDANTNEQITEVTTNG